MILGSGIIRRKTKGIPFNPKTEPILMIGIDDSYRTDYTIAYQDMWVDRGIKGVTYMRTDLTNMGSPNHLSWEQVAELKSSPGWEVECHTHTHRRLTELTFEEVTQEMEEVNQHFAENGLPIPEHHTFPYFAYNSTVQNAIRPFRKTMRTSENALNYYSTINLEAIKSYSIDMATREHLNASKSHIDKAVSENAILCFRLHEIVEGEPSDQWKGNRGLLNELLDYILDSGIKVVGVEELYQKVMEYRNQSN